MIVLHYMNESCSWEMHTDRTFVEYQYILTYSDRRCSLLMRSFERFDMIGPKTRSLVCLGCLKVAHDLAGAYKTKLWGLYQRWTIEELKIESWWFLLGGLNHILLFSITISWGYLVAPEMNVVRDHRGGTRRWSRIVNILKTSCKTEMVLIARVWSLSQRGRKWRKEQPKNDAVVLHQAQSHSVNGLLSQETLLRETGEAERSLASGPREKPPVYPSAAVSKMLVLSFDYKLLVGWTSIWFCYVFFSVKIGRHSWLNRIHYLYLSGKLTIWFMHKSASWCMACFGHICVGHFIHPLANQTGV